MEGITNLPYYYDPSSGTHKKWEGRNAVDGLITPNEIDCTAAGVTLFTVTTGFEGYLNFLKMYNSNAAAQEFVISDTDGTKSTIKLGAGETETWIGENAYMKFAVGAVTGTAGTGDHVHVTVSYYELEA